MHDTQLLVIGDSHADFWSGTDIYSAWDTIPGVRYHGIHSALAWNLLNDVSHSDVRALALGTIHSALAEGFGGWLMFAFGSVDCDHHVLKHAHELGIEGAVRSAVENYVGFILEIKQMHPKIAVWGPACAQLASLGDPTVGLEAERNFIILLFNAVLTQRLAEFGVPVMSVAELAIDEFGRSIANNLHDTHHLGQKFMPYALQLVNATLGLNLKPEKGFLAFEKRRVTVFEEVDTLEATEGKFLRLILPDSSQLISEITVKGNILAENTLTFAISHDNKNFHRFEIAAKKGYPPAGHIEHIPIGTFGRVVLIRGSVHPIQQADVDVYIHASPLFQNNQMYPKASMLAIRDQLVPQPVRTEQRPPTETYTVKGFPSLQSDYRSDAQPSHA